MKRFVLVCIILLGLPIAIWATDKQATSPASLSETEMLRLGEQMYRQGILPSGKNMKGIVQGDIETEGAMLACITCHFRSGIGTVEQSVMVLPVNAKNLFHPLYDDRINPGLPVPFRAMPAKAKMASPWYRLPVSARPAYTDETLADSIRKGIDPAGRKFNPTMPIYNLTDEEVKILVFYLRHLSAEYSPGVTEKTIRFATIVTDEVSQEDRDAMLVTFEASIRAKNSRADLMQPSRKAFVKKMDRAFREIILDVWELKGSPETWMSQLEAYEQKQPVFALIGGLAKGKWAPIHEFCEKKGIPCIFPITDLPVISDKDWYTLYISKGVYQEGEAVATYLGGIPEFAKDTAIIQVYRTNPDAEALAQGFQTTWKKIGGKTPLNITLTKDKKIDKTFWKKLTSEHKNGTFLLWLKDNDLAELSSLASTGNKPESIFLSGTLLKKQLYTLPVSVRPFMYIAYPHRLPLEKRAMVPWGTSSSVESWLHSMGLRSANLPISVRAFYLFQMLGDALTMVQSNFYRDYLLDSFDMMDDSTMADDYPWLSFGPGQRYASKGCYIVQLSQDEYPSIIKKNEWVNH